ncbi:MAG TPA: molybdate ABC transporter substrate-binding protein [Pyrinomonadaceae bacterium]|nr:molybdate ABC transporter substrate-binding protein [Pyrinomonadaceae bacterium]
MTTTLELGRRGAATSAIAALMAAVFLSFAACSGGAREAGGGVGGGVDERGAGARAEIVVAAAANLSDAFAEVARAFEARAGVRVVNSFGATADLARQIENGAPFDVFAAADLTHVERLERAGLVAAGTARVYARGRLVLWLPPGSRAAGLADFSGLAAPEVSRVALPRPEAAPYGRAAVEALDALGLWSRVEPKVVYAQNVAQARQFAATGNADAAFLPRSLARGQGGRVVEIDERLHSPVEQAVGVVIRAGGAEEAARRFVEFLTGEEGRAILARHGYDLPEAGR